MNKVIVTMITIGIIVSIYLTVALAESKLQQPKPGPYKVEDCDNILKEAMNETDRDIYSMAYPLQRSNTAIACYMSLMAPRQ